MYDYQDLIGYRLVQTEAQVKRGLLRVFSTNGIDLSFEQWIVLNALYREPGLIQQDIAQKTNKDKTNITRILEILQRRNLLFKEKGRDARELKTYLSPIGRELVEKAIPHVHHYNAVITADLSPEVVAGFIATLAVINRNISSFIETSDTASAGRS